MRLLIVALTLVLSVLPACRGRLPPPATGEGEGEEGEGEEGEGEEGEGEPPPPPPLCPAPPPPPADTSLAGTAFENLEVTWREPLHLCNSWREGGPLEGEVANKTRLTIGVQSRSSFGRETLATAALDGVAIERSPFGIDRNEGAVCAGDADVADWAVSDGGNFEQLQATVRYPLAGVGVVVETISILSFDENPRTTPVDYDHNSGDVFWGFEDPDVEESIALGNCDLVSAGQGYEAVEVLVGSADDGTGAALLRRYRTQDAFAGSYAVEWKDSVLVLSDRPGLATRASGFWPHTYVAEHHNWFEQSVIDFDRDPGNWHNFFRPGATATQGIVARQLTMSGINGFDGPQSFAVTERDLADGSEATRTFNDAAVRRVDSTSLGRGVFCSDDPDDEALVASVGYFGYDPVVLQVVYCETAASPGFLVKSVVPVFFFDQTAILGLPIDTVTPVRDGGRDGFRFDVADTTVTLGREDADWLRLTVVDDTAGGPHSLDTLTTFAELEATLGAAGDEVLRFVGRDDPSLSVELRRRNVGQGVGESAIYAPISLEVRTADRRVFIDGLDELTYTNTHHNWNDGLAAQRRGVDVEWLVDFAIDDPDEFLVYTVSARDDEGAFVSDARLRLLP